MTTVYEETAPLRMLNNGQRQLLVNLTERPMAGLDAPPPTARAARRLVTFGLARREGAVHHITLAGWVWIARALLADLPEQVTNPQGREARQWEKLADRLDMTEVIYHGTRGTDPSDTRMVTVEDPDSADILGTLRHVERHSPDGVNWGYCGSGPADCARSLLIAALGDAIAACGTCAGNGRVMPVDLEIEEPPVVPFDPHQHEAADALSCRECDGGYVALPYQDFKNEIIARLDAEWITDRMSILTWLDGHLASRQPELADR